MDLTTIIGIIVGFGAILGGQALEGGSISSLIQGPAFIIVIGGTIGAVTVGFTGADLKLAMRDLVISFKPPKVDNLQIIKEIVEMAKVARKDGLLALEKSLETVTNPFMKRYLQQIIDGLEPEMVREHMETEIYLEEEEAGIGSKVFESAGGFAPTVGIIGAVLGLIHVMQNLDDPSKLGGGIAVAFVATVYGVSFANLLCLPISVKLKRRVSEKMIAYTVVMEGLLALQAGHNPKVIEEKLQIFLSEKQKEAEK